MVVETSAWPRRSWTVRMSIPLSKRWVVKEWRRVWQVALLDRLATAPARFAPRKTSIPLFEARTRSLYELDMRPYGSPGPQELKLPLLDPTAHHPREPFAVQIPSAVRGVNAMTS